MSKTAAIKALGIILSAYPSAESFNREGYVKVAVAGLEAYPDEMLEFLANPKTGIVRKSKFIPTLAEMCAVMDAEWLRRRKAAEMDKRDAERRLASPEPIVSPETHARVSAEFRKLLATLEANAGSPMGETEKLQTKAEIQAMADMWLEQRKAVPVTLPKLSSAARATIK